MVEFQGVRRYTPGAAKRYGWCTVLYGFVHAVLQHAAHSCPLRRAQRRSPGRSPRSHLEHVTVLLLLLLLRVHAAAAARQQRAHAPGTAPPGRC